MTENDIATIIVDACYRVHTGLGPGLLETVYEAVLARELEERGLRVQRQVPVPIVWEGLHFDEGFRADLIVEDKVIVELKSVERTAPVHGKQLLTYLRLADKRLGLLVNFGEGLIKDGIKRVVNGLEEEGSRNAANAQSKAINHSPSAASRLRVNETQSSPHARRDAPMNVYYGVDFSGNHKKWSPNTKRSNVWIARVEDDHGLRLRSLHQVQALPGAGHPFDRLVALINNGAFSALAIDAPFSVPKHFVATTYRDLLQTVGALPLVDRPFPTGEAFFQAVTGQDTPLQPPKPLRRTEEYWRRKGVNVRSTLWTGARGGAPMTAACLKLLSEATWPIWPFDAADKASPLLVEAFPAAQLAYWRLPHAGYNGEKEPAGNVRQEMVEGLAEKVDLGDFPDTVKEDSDALDAVLCAFAARAAHLGLLGVELPTNGVHESEGWIAVHQ